MEARIITIRMIGVNDSRRRLVSILSRSRRLLVLQVGQRLFGFLVTIPACRMCCRLRVHTYHRLEEAHHEPTRDRYENRNHLPTINLNQQYQH